METPKDPRVRQGRGPSLCSAACPRRTHGSAPVKMIEADAEWILKEFYEIAGISRTGLAA
jgi:hypothetical protein